MKSILFLLVVFLLSACAPATLTPALTPAPLRQAQGIASPTGRGESTPTPAPTETPTPTPIPTYSIEQLKAMTPEQVMALAPEAPAGAVKSLYREAPGLVFYQDPETLSITSAYDLTSAEFYSTPEQIPLPPIHVSTDRDIFPLKNKNEMFYTDPSFDLQTAIENIANNIKDTVLDGEEPFYRLRVLQAYRDGLIPNIPDSVPPPKIYMGDFEDNVNFRPFGYNNRDETWFELEKRSYRDATIVSDGAGGIRLVQVWKQADGSVGTLWYHLTGETIKNDKDRRPKGMAIQFLLSSMFDTPIKKTVPQIDFIDFNGCFTIMQDEAFCTGFMADEVRARRQQAIEEWMTTLIIPMAMQNGQIQFPMRGSFQN